MSKSTHCLVSNKAQAAEHTSIQPCSSATAFMPRQKQIRKQPNTWGELSFPPPYREQAKFLELANHFLVLSERCNRKVMPIASARSFRGGKWRVA
jgi:hypothetical protein